MLILEVCTRLRPWLLTQSEPLLKRNASERLRLICVLMYEERRTRAVGVREG